MGTGAPLLTSCQLFLQVAAGTEPNSADFVRVCGVDFVASGQLVPWVWPAGVGSGACVAENIGPWSWALLETGVPQASPVTFNLTGK
jgi:hypothetical protein